MSRLSTPRFEQLSEKVQSALEPVRQNGKVADIYLQFANSEAAIVAYLDMEKAVREGSLEPSEVEAIKLRLSELTQCEFCLAVHSMKAKAAGLSLEQQLSIRRGKPIGDSRIDAIMAIVNHLYQAPGTLPANLLDAARDEDVTDAELVDITMAMATIFFTNITNHINDSKAAIPKAPELPDN